MQDKLYTGSAPGADSAQVTPIAAGARILLVEDDEDIQKINTIYLTQQGYGVATAGTIAEATAAVRNERFDLIVLDVQLPDGSGLDFCEKIRQNTIIPIIFLTCSGEEQDKVKGLMAGGDDYMSKPYGLSELAARIHALLRRVKQGNTQILEFPPLRIDKLNQRVYVDGASVVMTPKEYQILILLAENAGRTLPAEELYEKIWGMAPLDGLKTVNVHISALRKKLNLGDESRIEIRAIRNAGYSLEVDNG